MERLARPGDVLLHRIRTGEDPWGIRTAQEYHRAPAKIHYRHAALYETDGWKIQATFPGVTFTEVDWDNPILELWRVRGWTIDRACRAIEWATEQLCRPFDLVAFLSLGHFSNRRAALCTKLVTDAWRKAGIVLVEPEPSVLFPNDLAASPQLYRVA